MDNSGKPEVIVAKTAGFCFGVQRALDEVYRQIACGVKPIYTYGPIIHNEEVVRELEAKGVRAISGKEELKTLTEGTVIIRSHGVSRAICEQIEQQGLVLVDATCPFVKKIHRIADRRGPETDIVIIGNDGHPEVEGIKGWCRGRVTVIGAEEEARRFKAREGHPVCVVSQTTFNYKKFDKLVEILLQMGYIKMDVLNTICSATEERQQEAQKIARQADAMIVIGGRSSSNTRKLYEICQNECVNTYYIQTLKDLDVRRLHSVSCVGITAGASTPKNLIEEVSKQWKI